MRLIDADAAYKAACEGADNWDGAYSPYRYDRIREEMDKVPTFSPWHRVEEPPKYAGRYVVWCGVNWHGEGMYDDIMIARYDWSSGRWYVEADHSLKGPICGDIRYWMPIEPPKEENK